MQRTDSNHLIMIMIIIIIIIILIIIIWISDSSLNESRPLVVFYDGYSSTHLHRLSSSRLATVNNSHSLTNLFKLDALAGWLFSQLVSLFVCTVEYEPRECESASVGVGTRRQPK